MEGIMQTWPHATGITFIITLIYHTPEWGVPIPNLVFQSSYVLYVEAHKGIREQYVIAYIRSISITPQYIFFH